MTWLLFRRCFKQDLYCNTKTSYSNHYHCISSEPMIMSNKKVFTLLIFLFMDPHPDYKYGSCCCCHSRQPTIAPEDFLHQRQEGVCYCNRCHCVHQYFLSSCMFSGPLVTHVLNALQKGDQKGPRS